MTFDGTAACAEAVDLARREVSMRVLSDPAVFEAEMARIFARAWLFLAHESEVPSPGDFVVRRMGLDRVVVVRQDDGSIEVLLNMCRHRGMEICRPDAGQTRQFQCPYHGWIYGLDGGFLGAPVAKQQMHGDVMTRAELTLRKPKVGVFCGMVFAAWDPAVPTLKDYLGDIASYLRILFDKTRNGLEILGPPQRTVIAANWKTAAEQFSGDDYHSRTLHASLSEVLTADMPEEAKAKMREARDSGDHNHHVDVSTRHGHAAMCFPRPSFSLESGRAEYEGSIQDYLRRALPNGVSANIVDEVLERFNDGELEIMAFCPPQTGSIFPNFGSVQATYPTGSFTCLHTFAPLDPNHFEFMTWLLVEKDADAESKRRSARTSAGVLGSSGMVEQDDSDAWPSIQRAARGYMGSTDTMKYQAVTGINKPPQWPGGGTVYAGFSKDDNQWAWWTRWREMMSLAPAEPAGVGHHG